MSTGPVLLPSYSQPQAILQQPSQNQSQSVVVISTGQNHQQTYAIENTEMNRTLYNNTNKIVFQQHSKPMTVASVITSGNLLAVATPTVTAATPIVTSSTVEPKRAHDCEY